MGRVMIVFSPMFAISSRVTGPTDSSPPSRDAPAIFSSPEGLGICVKPFVSSMAFHVPASAAPVKVPSKNSSFVTSSATTSAVCFRPAFAAYHSLLAAVMPACSRPSPISSFVPVARSRSPTMP